MKNLFKKTLAFFLTSSLVASAAVIPTAAASEKEKPKNYKEGEVIAVLKDNAAGKFQSSKKASAVYGSGIKLKGSYTFSANKGNKLKIAALKSSSLSTEQLIKKVEKLGDVKYAFPNFIKKAASVTNDAYSDYLWALENKGQNNGKDGLDSKASVNWDNAAKSEEDQVVAIIDSGIDYTHEDLKDIVWNNPYGAKLIGKHGYDFTGSSDDGEPMDDNGHGSHCAGIVAGQHNDVGIAGINKSNVKIMALKFLDASGYGSDEDALACFDYISRAVSLGTKVAAINCSWGGAGSSEEKLMYDELFDELGKQGIITCVAAGNESENLDEQEEGDFDFFFGGGISTPAASDSRYCITVAASNGKDTLASFSNTGESKVDIAAPGTEILSSVCYNCFNPSVYSDEQIEKLCAYYQRFDNKVKKGEFGYPNLMEMSTDDEAENGIVGFSIKKSKEFFGTKGKSLALQPDDDGTIVFEMPFKAESEGDYTTSFMFSADSVTSGYVYDVSADTSFNDIVNGDDDDDFIIYFGKGKKNSQEFYCDGGYWDHVVVESDSYDDDEDYEDESVKAKSGDDEDDSDTANESTDRKLVFVINASDTVYIDDLAISKSDADPEDFGKYDFYNGTSMATPYVAGAIALMKNALPEINTIDALNIVRNTGRTATELLGTVNTASVLSLDRPDEIPPMITSIDYNDGGKVVIDGSFRDVTKVTVNGDEVKADKADNTQIIIPDKNYNTNNVEFKIENENGKDTYKTLLSNKKSYELATELVGTPLDNGDGIFVNAGDVAYYIGANNTVGIISYDYDFKSYRITDGLYELNIDSLGEEGAVGSITSAAYKDGKIYFTALFEILSARSGRTIGYDSAFASYDLTTGKTESLGELDEEIFMGNSVAVYKGDVYVLGGHAIDGSKLSDSVYKLEKDKLVKTEFKLPIGRAYTKYIEYDGKLIGAYGTIPSGNVPSIISFDGSKFTKSKLELDCEDYDEVAVGTNSWTMKVYNGNLGLDKDGVFFNGSYCYGLGDTFTYNPNTEEAVSSEYSFNNILKGPRINGTTLPGAFIGFNVVVVAEEEEEDDEWWPFAASSAKTSVKANKASEDTVEAYKITLNNGAPKPQDIDPIDYPIDYPDVKTPAKISAKSASLKAGATKTLKVTGASVKSWTSSNKKVATVKKGKVTALTKGSATITATLSNGKKLTSKIKVTTNPKLKKKSVTVKLGKTVKVKLKGKAKGVKNKYKNTKFAKVKSKKSAKTLKITGLKKGTTTLKITVNGKILKLKVTVK